MNLIIRNATLDDLPGIMQVEQDWPEGQRAPAEKMLARIEKSGPGVFVAVVDGAIVGVTTSCLLRYDREHLDRFTSWDDVTNHGRFFNPGEIKDTNAVYVASTGIRKSHRGSGIFRKLIGAQIELSKRLGLRFCITAAIMEGYANYCKIHGSVSAKEYALKRKGDAFVDPLIEKLRRVGFGLPDEHHVLAEYYASEDAHDWSALMVCDNNPAQKISLTPHSSASS